MKVLNLFLFTCEVPHIIFVDFLVLFLQTMPLEIDWPFSKGRSVLLPRRNFVVQLSQFLTQEKKSCQCIVVYLKMDPIFDALLPENKNLIPTLRHMFLAWKFKWPVHNWLSLHADNCLPISIILNVNLPKSVFYTSNRHPSGYTIDK